MIYIVWRCKCRKSQISGKYRLGRFLRLIMICKFCNRKNTIYPKYMYENPRYARQKLMELS